MPIYEYECGNCSSRFEVRRAFNSESVDVCPKCQLQGRQIFSPTAIIFNGPGFYITDSRKNEAKSENCGDTVTSST